MSMNLLKKFAGLFKSNKPQPPEITIKSDGGRMVVNSTAIEKHFREHYRRLYL